MLAKATPSEGQCQEKTKAESGAVEFAMSTRQIAGRRGSKRKQGVAKQGVWEGGKREREAAGLGAVLWLVPRSVGIPCSVRCPIIQQKKRKSAREKNTERGGGEGGSLPGGVIGKVDEES